MSVSVGDIYVSLGVDMSAFTEELSKAEQIAQGSTTKIKDRFKAVASSLSDLRTQAKAVKEALATTTDFRVRGDDALDKLHGQLDKVRQSGTATDATLDKLSLAFEANARGARTYVQALDKIASDKGASASVRDLAKALADEAREANFDVAALEKRSRALDQMIAKQSRSFTSLRKQLEPQPAGGQGGHGVVPPQAAASAAARALEGTVSIRAAERFLSDTLGLGKVLQSVFPIVGGLAFLDLLGGLVGRAQELYETFKKIQEAPQRINREFSELNQTLLVGNDQLRVSNDRLENEIAKLEGKPQNGLKLALDEAAAAADNLAQSLRNDIEQLQKLLEQEQIGTLKGFFTGRAPTKEITEENKKFLNDLVNIDITTGQRLRGAKTPQERAATAEEASGERFDRLEAEIAREQNALAEARKRQARRNAPAQTGVVGGMALSTGPTTTPQSAEDEILMRERRLDVLFQAEQMFQLTERNQTLTQKKEKLDQAKQGQAPRNPFGDTMNNLAAQIEAARASLEAIGKSDTSQVLAKSWGKAQESIARLNNELKRQLTLEEQVKILTDEDTLAITQAEVEWKTKLDQTTTSITNRIAALKLMTDAIGKGAAATRRAAIESQVMQAVGSKYNDEQFLNQKDSVTGETHRAQVENLRRQFGAEYDEQRRQQSGQNIQKLTDQIDLEKSLALVQARGAAAVRLQTLAYQLRNMAMQGATREELQAQMDLFQAQQKNQSAANVANLDQQIDATQRLSAAQLHGSEAVRQAQLQLKYEEMKRQGASPLEIEKTQKLDQIEYQKQITAEALQSGMAYKNRLDLLDKQITLLQSVKMSGDEEVAREISLKNLEEERVHILSQQALAIGTACDGMAAFFREMATQAESSAQMVHDAFASAFNGINDQLGRLMTGQKTSWASFLQSLGQQISKMALMGLEHEVAGKILGSIASRRQQAGGTNPVNQPAAQHGITAALGHIFGGTLKRDGNTPATALFVTMTGANGIPIWSTGGTGASITTPDFGVTAGDLFKLEHGGEGDEPTPARSTQTLENGARPKPSVWGQIGSAALQIGLGMLGASLSGGGSKGTSETPSSGSDTAYPRDPSGLIIRGGAYAKGGRPPVGKVSLVGEKGPELFVPDRPGTIVPNHKINFAGFRAAGGSVDPGRAYMVGEHGPEAFASISMPGPNGASPQPYQIVNYSIDARGTDPVLTEQRTKGAIVAAHQSAIVNSVQTSDERAKRRPQR